VVLLDSRVNNLGIALRWTAYTGDIPLAAYRVLRQVVGSVNVEQIAVITDPQDTTFIDTTVSAGFQLRYQIEVVNEAGLTALSNERLGRLQLVRPDLRLGFDAMAGTATVSWSLATDGFVGYCVFR
jgi:hypothetical protein